MVNAESLVDHGRSAYTRYSPKQVLISCFVDAGKDFVPPYEDPELKLGGLLALNLHEFSSDVEEIADQVSNLFIIVDFPFYTTTALPALHLWPHPGNNLSLEFFPTP